MNFFKKCNFFFKRPKIIIITGNSAVITSEIVYQVLSQKLKARKVQIQNLPFVDKKEILVIESKTEELESLNFLAKNSRLPLLLVTNLGEIPPDTIFFTGDKKKLQRNYKIYKCLAQNQPVSFKF